MNLEISNFSLAIAAVLVMISIGINMKEKLGMTKDIIYSIIRAIIQLVIVGYVLKYIFQVDNIFLTLAMVLVMIFNASMNAKKRNDNLENGFRHSFVAIGASTVITLGMLLLAGAIKFIPSQIVPISGMIASNSMIAIGLCYRTMAAQFHDQRQQVLEKLALGADIKLASYPILRSSIKTAMQPTIDSAKTVGIVSLPGMMSGLIFAGVDPVHAIKYQIMVTFMMLAATGLGSVIAGYLSYREYYNEYSQLN